MIKKIIVYPYSIIFAPYLRHLSYTKNYNIVSAIVPGKLIKEDIDASFIDEGSQVSVPLCSGFESHLDQCDTVLWADYDYNENQIFYNKVISQMKYVINIGKNIICCQELNSNIVDEFKLIAENNNCIFNYLFDCDNQRVYDINNYDADISVPIITVMGVSENCSKFETQLSIRRFLLDKGYKVSQIGSRQGCELLDFHSFPQFMINNNYNEVQKIDIFKKTIAKIQYTENPDVIIIGIPGGIIQFNEKENMHFGIFAYEICNAIDSDYNIVNSWVDTIKKIFNDLEKIVQYRYNTQVDSICLSNISIFNDHSVIDRESLEYNVYNTSKVDECIKNLGVDSIYNVMDNNSMERLTNHIVEKLSN